LKDSVWELEGKMEVMQDDAEVMRVKVEQEIFSSRCANALRLIAGAFSEKMRGLKGSAITAMRLEFERHSRVLKWVGNTLCERMRCSKVAAIMGLRLGYAGRSKGEIKDENQRIISSLQGRLKGLQIKYDQLKDDPTALKSMKFELKEEKKKVKALETERSQLTKKIESIVDGSELNQIRNHSKDMESQLAIESKQVNSLAGEINLLRNELKMRAEREEDELLASQEATGLLEREIALTRAELEENQRMLDLALTLTLTLTLIGGKSKDV